MMNKPRGPMRGAAMGGRPSMKNVNTNTEPAVLGRKASDRGEPDPESCVNVCAIVNVVLIRERKIIKLAKEHARQCSKLPSILYVTSHLSLAAQHFVL